MSDAALTDDGRSNPRPPPGMELMGWVRDDGDEYHDFRYAVPGRRTGDFRRGGWIPVFVRAQEQTDD